MKTKSKQQGGFFMRKSTHRRKMNELTEINKNLTTTIMNLTDEIEKYKNENTVLNGKLLKCLEMRKRYANKITRRNCNTQIDSTLANSLNLFLKSFVDEP